MSLHGMSDGLGQTFSRTSGRPCCDGKKKKSWADGALRTTYQQEYYEKEAARASALDRLKLIAAPREPPAKFDASTTYHGDFRQYESAQRPLMRPINAREQENIPFQGQSTYAANYDPKAATYKRVKPEHGSTTSAGPFEGESTSKLDYKHWGVPRPRSAIQQASTAQSTAAFAGESAYADAFKHYPHVKREPAFKMKDSDDPYPKGPLDTGTIYNMAYTGKATEMPVRHKPADSHVQDVGWYDGVPSTEYGKQFFEKAGAQAAHGQRPFPEGAFNGSTNYNADYQQRQVGDRAQSLKPQGVQMERVPFTGASTYTDAFLKRDMPQYERVRAKQLYEPNPATFEGVSTNKSDFRQWEAQPYARGGPQNSTNVPLRSLAPFDGRSTYNGDFQRLQGKPAGILRPQRDALSTGAFDGTTTYHIDFVPKEAERWPVHNVVWLEQTLIKNHWNPIFGETVQ